MGNVITKAQYDQMKSWTQSIYSKTKGTTPSISDVTQDGIVLASQAQTLQSLLTTAYSGYVSVGCSSHNSSVDASDYVGQNISYKPCTDNSTVVTCTTVKNSNYTNYSCSSNYTSDNSHDGGDK